MAAVVEELDELYSDGRSASYQALREMPRTEAAIKETSAKPQGPLIIAISIEQQRLRVYDANGLFAESPVSMECVLHQIVPLGPHRSLILGRVTLMHVRDDAVDVARLHIDTQALRLVGRAQGNMYIHTTDAFELARIEAI